MVWREASINADFGRGPAGYSALVHLGGHTYGCLWEQGPADFIQNLKFTVFSTGFGDRRAEKEQAPTAGSIRMERSLANISTTDVTEHSEAMAVGADGSVLEVARHVLE